MVLSTLKNGNLKSRPEFRQAGNPCTDWCSKLPGPRCLSMAGREAWNGWPLMPILLMSTLVHLLRSGFRQPCRCPASLFKTSAKLNEGLHFLPLQEWDFWVETCRFLSFISLLEKQKGSHCFSSLSQRECQANDKTRVGSSSNADKGCQSPAWEGEGPPASCSCVASAAAAWVTWSLHCPWPRSS